VAFLLLLVACGSRTGLFTDDFSVALGPDAGGSSSSGGIGIGVLDASDDVPTLDVRPPTDVDRTGCPDADALLVYTITTSYDLQSFNPATNAFTNIGHISCPTNGGPDDTPFSMAVDRRGTAYILFQDARIYQVSTATGACIATSYAPGQSNFQLFGMGFATNSSGPTETLYVAGDDQQSPLSGQHGANGIAKIDPNTFNLTPVTVAPTVVQAELTGTGDGRLYAFYSKVRDQGIDSPPPSYIGEIDTDTGDVIGERRFDTVGQGHDWAFAFWGGDFYMFHANLGNPTTVTRWRPSDDSVTDVATNPNPVVGAGVSTCAPQ
jgi:hypothetical protein